MDAQAHKQRLAALFDQIAPGYDSPALRFFPFTADLAVSVLRPRPGSKILDAATGSGAMAVALAQAVGPQGRVMAIDLSEAMLARAEHNVRKMALGNVDLFEMDAEAPEFRSGYFDAVACGFGLYFLPDMARALGQWRRLTKPGGGILFSSFGVQNFQPLQGLLFEDLRAAGLDVEPAELAAWRLQEPEVCEGLLAQAGLEDCKVRKVPMGYHLREAADWWEVVWHSELRGLVQSLAPAAQDALRDSHLQRVAETATEEGIWLEVEVLLCSGVVPA